MRSNRNSMYELSNIASDPTLRNPHIHSRLSSLSKLTAPLKAVASAATTPVSSVMDATSAINLPIPPPAALHNSNSAITANNGVRNEYDRSPIPGRSSSIPSNRNSMSSSTITSTSTITPSTSKLQLLSDTESGSESEPSRSRSSSAGFGLGMGMGIVPGFAVASSKRNYDFHALFKNQGVPEDDYLIEDYGCALQREILLQGRLYISEHHLCFYANIFGWVTSLVIPFEDVMAIEKRMTALIIPNAIQISTLTQRNTFASFLSRDTTYELIQSLWRTSHPNGVPSSSNILKVDGKLEVNGEGHRNEESLDAGGEGRHRQTTCGCKDHYETKALETTFVGSPEKIYNLLYTGPFLKDFLVEDQKCTDVQVAEWSTEAPDTSLPSRNVNYIRPLSGPLGPKQTKCEILETQSHMDFDDHITLDSSTQTPDVPSGNSFAVKTKICLMWSKNGGTRMLVTCKVDWTKSSFLKGVIEKAAIDGQKTYHGALAKAMRTHISANLSIFAEGDATTALEEEEEIIETISVAQHSTIPFTIDFRDMSPKTLMALTIIALLLLSNIYSLSHSPSRTSLTTTTYTGASRLTDKDQDVVALAVRSAIKDFVEGNVNFKNQVSREKEMVESGDTEWVIKELRDVRKAVEELEGRIGKLKAVIMEGDLSARGAKGNGRKMEL